MKREGLMFRQNGRKRKVVGLMSLIFGELVWWV